MRFCTTGDAGSVNRVPVSSVCQSLSQRARSAVGGAGDGVRRRAGTPGCVQENEQREDYGWNRFHNGLVLNADTRASHGQDVERFKGSFFIRVGWLGNH